MDVVNQFRKPTIALSASFDMQLITDLFPLIFRWAGTQQGQVQELGRRDGLHFRRVGWILNRIHRLKSSTTTSSAHGSSPKWIVLSWRQRFSVEIWTKGVGELKNLFTLLNKYTRKGGQHDSTSSIKHWKQRGHKIKLKKKCQTSWFLLRKPTQLFSKRK